MKDCHEGLCSIQFMQKISTYFTKELMYIMWSRNRPSRILDWCTLYQGVIIYSLSLMMSSNFIIYYKFTPENTVKSEAKHFSKLISIQNIPIYTTLRGKPTTYVVKNICKPYQRISCFCWGLVGNDYNGLALSKDYQIQSYDWWQNNCPIIKPITKQSAATQ